jgi:predicted MPP superfamily phosphohydrolase
MTRRVLRTAGALFLLGFCFAAWALLIEPGWVVWRTYSVETSKWPKSLDGFTIAFITDTHVGSPHISLEKMADIVERTNALKPDLVLLGGDYVIQGVAFGAPVHSREIASVLAKLTARHGVYAVMGNHDAWENAPRMISEFEALGIKVLEDASTRIDTEKGAIWLAGVSDETTAPHDIGKALAGTDAMAPVILFTHSPDIFPNVPPGIALALAGHTHGGQVYVPFLGRPVVPSAYGERYALGLIEEEGKMLFVSPGIGTSIFPIRFLTRPEVSIIELRGR